MESMKDSASTVSTKYEEMRLQHSQLESRLRGLQEAFHDMKDQVSAQRSRELDIENQLAEVSKVAPFLSYSYSYLFIISIINDYWFSFFVLAIVCSACTDPPSESERSPRMDTTSQ